MSFPPDFCSDCEEPEPEYRAQPQPALRPSPRLTRDTSLKATSSPQICHPAVGGRGGIAPHAGGESTRLRPQQSTLCPVAGLVPPSLGLLSPIFAVLCLLPGIYYQLRRKGRLSPGALKPPPVSHLLPQIKGTIQQEGQGKDCVVYQSVWVQRRDMNQLMT